MTLNTTRMTRSFLKLPALEFSPAWALTSEDERAFVRADDHPDGPQSLAELLPYLQHATQTTEFSMQAKALGLSQVLVGRGQAWIGGESGFCYTPDEYPELSPHSIVMIDPDHMPAHLSLVDLFLHEAAHIFTNGEAHSWPFLVMLNVMRIRCGLGPSTDSYDWRDTRYSPDLARLSLSDSDVQNSAADLGRLLAPMPFNVGELRFLIQGIWNEVASNVVDTTTNVDFEELCRSTAQRELARWMNAAQPGETR